MNTQLIDYQVSSSKNGKILLVSSVAGLGLLATAAPSHAAAPADVTAAVTDITSTMTALGGLAAAALAVVLVPLGIKYGLGFAKQVMSKG